MNNLLNALGDRVKPCGKDKWIARCPMPNHDDKDFATSISIGHTGNVIAYCHGCGANGEDLYNHYELDKDELFGGRKLERSKEWIPPHVKDRYDEDKLVLAYMEADKAKGLIISLQDQKRHKLAVARIKGTEDKYII